MDIIKFVLKSYFGGCIGCFGALTFIVVITLLFGLVVGPQLAMATSKISQSFPELLSTLMPGGFPPLNGTFPANPGFSSNKTPAPPFEVFITGGNDSEGNRLTSFTQKEAEKVNFWVSAPKGVSVRFGLYMTIPGQGRVPFGSKFNTNPAGKPVNCGKFGDQTPNIGNYTLEAVPEGSSEPAGRIKFTVNE